MVKTMRQNTQPEKQSLTPMQKQAVLVCIVCALAALLTIGITLVLIHRGKEPAASSEQPGTEQPADDANIADHYQINEQSSALLPETADAGDAYQSETLFIGDSNTVRLYANGLISLQQFCAKEGIGTSAALNEGIVTFKKDSSRYTIAEAVAKMKPRRVVIMLGTNDTGMAVEDFISNYKQLVQAIQTSYPYTDIIVNTVPPVPADHSNYPNMDQTKIDDFNMALLSMCEEMGLKFLNTAEALKDSTGYGNADYYQSGDIHLKTSGLKVLLNYLCTHAYETEDRRPDTNNIPSRAEYVPDPSSAVASSSSEVTSSSSEVQEDTTQYQASYRVDKTGGGTLSAGNDNGKKNAKGGAAQMYGLPDRLRPLSAAEEQVMLAVWACREPATRRDIDEKLRGKGWAPATVLTFLYRLEEKGWVKSGKQGNHNIYAATVTQRAYGVWSMRQRLDTLFGGDLAAAVRALVSESGCGQSELEQAMKVLEEKHLEAEEYDLYDPYG